LKAASRSAADKAQPLAGGVELGQQNPQEQFAEAPAHFERARLLLQPWKETYSQWHDPPQPKNKYGVGDHQEQKVLPIKWVVLVVDLLLGCFFLLLLRAWLFDGDLFVQFDKCIKVACHDPLPKLAAPLLRCHHMAKRA
jgi:hypothetical protein